MNISIFCLIIFSDESIPDSTIRPSEDDDDVDTPSRTNNHDIAVEYPHKNDWKQVPVKQATQIT
jgi:hypothetical protein